MKSSLLTKIWILSPTRTKACSGQSFYPAIGKITTTLLFTLLLAVIIAFLLAFFYSKKLSKPIKRLIHMLKKNNSEPLDDIVSNIFNQVSELNVFV